MCTGTQHTASVHGEASLHHPEQPLHGDGIGTATVTAVETQQDTVAPRTGRGLPAGPSRCRRATDQTHCAPTGSKDGGTLSASGPTAGGTWKPGLCGFRWDRVHPPGAQGPHLARTVSGRAWRWAWPRWLPGWSTWYDFTPHTPPRGRPGSPARPPGRRGNGTRKMAEQRDAGTVSSPGTAASAPVLPVSPALPRARPAVTRATSAGRPRKSLGVARLGARR